MDNYNLHLKLADDFYNDFTRQKNLFFGLIFLELSYQEYLIAELSIGADDSNYIMLEDKKRRTLSDLINLRTIIGFC